jgi:hypothetical protein
VLSDCLGMRRLSEECSAALIKGKTKRLKPKFLNAPLFALDDCMAPSLSRPFRIHNVSQKTATRSPANVYKMFNAEISRPPVSQITAPYLWQHSFMPLVRTSSSTLELPLCIRPCSRVRMDSPFHFFKWRVHLR